MKKRLITFFLSLSVLLLSGYQLYFYAVQDYIAGSHVESFEHSGHVGSTADKNNPEQVKSHLSCGKENFKIRAADNEGEEDEISLYKSLKKYTKNSSNYFAAVFYTHLLGYFCVYVKKRLSLFKHVSFFSSHNRYIIFRVLRI